MERTMKVTGKGKISVKPETIRLMITQRDTKGEYDEAVKESTRQKGELNQALEGAGLKKSDLKTLSFDIDTDYESYQEKGTWKRKFKGCDMLPLLNVRLKWGLLSQGVYRPQYL